VKKTNAIDKGNKTFQPKFINWSYLYLGNVARIHTNKNIIKINFKANQNQPGINLKKPIEIIGNQPPKKR
jgi:hypothetical protein